MASNRAQRDSLAKVQREVAACRRCPRLVRWREEVARTGRASYAGQVYWGRGVPGFGDPHATLVIVGLAPAAHGANRTGRMFTGDRSGDWLFAALYRAGFASQPTSTSREDGLVLTGAYITATVHCAPPANKPETSERANCAPFLARELSLLRRTAVVVALGQVAWQAVAAQAGLRPRPTFGHLAESPLPGGLVMLGSYHP
ncbi:MAG: uracil-DNA glycosylase, partial [Acidimicrobiales bacterium]